MSTKKKSPSLYVIAGPNGAGKTTFAKEEGGTLTVADADTFAVIFKTAER